MQAERVSAGLTRNKSPWLLGDVQWTAKLQKKAVVWLARKLQKSILKLTADDYAENALQVCRSARRLHLECPQSEGLALF